MASNSQTPAVENNDIQINKLLRVLNSFRTQNIVPVDKSRLGKLCHTCRSVLDKWDVFLWKMEREKKALCTIPNYHQNMVTWIREMEGGCVLCMRLFDSFPKEEAQKLRRGLAGHFTIGLSLKLDTIFSEPWRLSVTVEEISKDETHQQIEGVIQLIPKSTNSCYRAFELAPSTGSDISLSFAKDWIKACRTSHKRCRRRERIGRLPTRLLELHEGGVRLCITVNATSCQEYVTLSHCWGTLQILKLKTSNIDTLMEGVSFESLCKTFKDAVKVTRALGYSYLWIDSLCIVQDDEDDWRKESALMKEVYCNAVVNLAATDAKDGPFGLFRERDVSRASRQYIQTTTSDPNDYKGRMNSQIFEIMDDRAYYRCLSRTLLSNRAWAFQERYLAERTIHFTSEQLFCECRYEIACEAWPKGVKPALARMGDIPFPGRTYKHGKEEEWRQVVFHYSRAKLTYPRDKLVALSGVAHKHQETTGDIYVAGLWRYGLEEHLCWAVERILEDQLPTSGVHSTPYRAPSWSWASQDRSVTWRLSSSVNSWTNSHAVSLIDILDINLVPAGPDALGQLQDAKMRLRCVPIIKGNVILKLLDASSKPRNDTYNVHNQEDLDVPIGVVCDVYPDHDMEDKNIIRSLYFLPVLAGENEQADRSVRWGYPKAASISGLILQRADERGPGYFTRFGACYITHQVSYYSELIELFSEWSDCFMDEALYEEVLEVDETGGEKHVISLV